MGHAMSMTSSAETASMVALDGLMALREWFVGFILVDSFLVVDIL